MKSYARTGETLWSGELRFEADRKRPRAYVEVIDYSGPERWVLETKGVYEYDEGAGSFITVSE